MSSETSGNAFERIFTNDEKASLRGEVFLNRELIAMDFSGADLRGASFERTTLVGCNLAGADLRGVWFISSELRDVVLEGALFGENRFDGTMLMDVVGVNEETRDLVRRMGGTFQPAHASRR